MFNLSRTQVSTIVVGDFEEPVVNEVSAWNEALVTILRAERAGGAHLLGHFTLALDVAQRMMGDTMPFLEEFRQTLFNHVTQYDGMNVYVQASLPEGTVVLE